MLLLLLVCARIVLGHDNATHVSPAHTASDGAWFLWTVLLLFVVIIALALACGTWSYGYPVVISDYGQYYDEAHGLHRHARYYFYDGPIVVQDQAPPQGIDQRNYGRVPPRENIYEGTSDPLGEYRLGTVYKQEPKASVAREGIARTHHFITYIVVLVFVRTVHERAPLVALPITITPVHIHVYHTNTIPYA
jgi:hypothetical protein